MPCAKQSRLAEWVTLATFSSSRHKEKTYRVKLNTRTGVIGCDCPVWIYRMKGHTRWCKHTAQAARHLSCRMPRNGRSNPASPTVGLGLSEQMGTGSPEQLELIPAHYSRI